MTDDVLIDVQILHKDEENDWDEYVSAHPDSNLYHLCGWRDVIERTYGHDSYYLIAKRDGVICGVCPLVHLDHFIFGNSLYSIPYFDLGGILADDADCERALLDAVITQAEQLGVDNIELRQDSPLGLLSERDGKTYHHTGSDIAVACRSHKVRMVLELPETSEQLMASFKTKFRTKVRLPGKKGCSFRSGGKELIDDFYNVFCINMRDLGSPVHARRLFDNVMDVFAEKARLFIVDKGDERLAAGMVIGFKDMLFNPWASSLKSYANIRPNTHLYWNILDYAIAQGFSRFDFGRSDPGGNTYVFKEQWGAVPVPVNWNLLNLQGEIGEDTDKTDKSKFDTAIHYWKKLPLPVANLLGPAIRKHIGL